MTDTADTPHYLRFARALALASALGTAGVASGCCPLVPDTVVCAHCTCYGAATSASAPLTCTALHRDTTCCPPLVPVSHPLPVPGPLSPPDLPA